MLNNNELKKELNNKKMELAIDQLCDIFQNIERQDKDYFTYNETPFHYNISHRVNYPELLHEYDPNDGYELITVIPQFINDYGVLEYSLTLISYSESGEIITPTIYAQHEIGDKQLTERQINKMDKENKRDADKWTAIKDRLYHFSPGKHLTIKNVITDRTCYCNITHEHYFRGVTVELITRDIDDIKHLIALRDLTYNL